MINNPLIECLRDYAKSGDTIRCEIVTKSLDIIAESGEFVPNLVPQLWEQLPHIDRGTICRTIREATAHKDDAAVILEIAEDAD